MRLVSFDVFDTLLTRTCAEPVDVFVRLGARLREQGLIIVPPSDFATRRIRTEAAAWHCSHPPREPGLSAIYAGLAREFGWNETQRDAALAVECTVETEGIRAVPGMAADVARARAAAGRVAFVTDTYLPGALIRQWLEAAGFWCEGDRLFISNEAGESKGAGGIYRQIARELGVAPGEWTHHGDNPSADVARAQAAGVRVGPRLAGRLSARERQLRGQPLPPAWRSLLAGAARLARLDQPDRDPAATPDAPWALGAGVAGPLFHGFVDWCLDEAVKREITDLYFLARGGQVFQRIATEIQRVRPRPLHLHYLPASRLAFAGPDPGDAVQLRALVAPGTLFHSAHQAFVHAGLGGPGTPEPDWLPRAAWHRNLEPAERQRLADWLLAPAQRTIVSSALASRASRARDYLTARGLVAGSRAAVVDTGWHGTIQCSLSALLGTPGHPAPLTGFYLGLVDDSIPASGIRLGYFNTFRPPPGRHDGAWYTLLELMARADHGLLLGFERDAGKIPAPRFAPIAAEEAAEALRFQEAVLCFCRRALVAGAELSAAPRGVLAQVVIDGCSALYLHPSASEARVLGQLPHSDQMLERQYAVLCPPMNWLEACRAMLFRRHRPTNWWVTGQACVTGFPPLHVYAALRRLRALRRERRRPSASHPAQAVCPQRTG